MKQLKACSLLASTLIITACGNLDLLTSAAGTQQNVHSFKETQPEKSLTYSALPDKTPVSRKEAYDAIIFAMNAANEQHGYSQSWGEYYGQGSWILSSDQGIAIDFRNKINHGITHVTTSYQLILEDQKNGIHASLKPDNQFAKTEGFNLFGEVTPLYPYPQLEFTTNQIYKNIEWIPLPRQQQYQGDIISEFPKTSLKANFDRLLTPVKQTKENPLNASKTDYLYEVKLGNHIHLVAMSFYSYRNGSKANYRFIQYYKLNPNGSNTYDSTIAKRMKSSLVAIAQD